jgi:hypothetical protein
LLQSRRQLWRSLHLGQARRLAVVRGIVFAGVVAVVVSATPATASTPSPTSRPCPSASLVNAALGQHDGSPVTTTTAYSKTCTYPGRTRLSSVSVTFQEDSASQFATDESAVTKTGLKIITVHGLGQAAWTTGLGDLYVFDGHEQIKIHALVVGITSPSTATAKVEALARKLL